MPKRRRRFVGILPRLTQGLRALGRWAVGHPQPIVLLGFLWLTLWVLWGFAQRTDAFRIASVHLPAQSSLKLHEPLIGENLWQVDIRGLAGSLKRQQPWLKEVRVVRELPNAIRVEAIERVPVAQVRAGQWYPIDGEGFILPQGNAGAAEGLIRVNGFEGIGTGLRIGRDNTDERLKLALRVLKVLRRAPPPVSRHVTEVNVADPEEIHLLIDDETEVRCGSEAELETHLKRLQAALKAIAREQLTVRYIDVRFPEPVIGPRPASS